MTDNLRRVGLIANPDKTSTGAVVRRALRLVREAGREVRTDSATADFARLDTASSPDIATLSRQCDLLLVLGGDGTMLRVAREAAGSRTPIFGVNLGTLGFLTTCAANELARALECVWTGQCLVESRSLIEARRRGAPARAVELALNDFVISRGAVPRLIELEVRVDGELLTSYRGDGLIISSPTGSTAYSLAAGGAVVSPQAEVFALTPICPHTLSNRSVIVSLAATVEVNVRSQRVETYLAADGQPRFQLKAGDRMGFQRSRHTAPLVRLPGTSFFDTLRQKMNWSGSPV